MNSEEQKTWYSDLWPEQFVLRGGRFGTRVYPPLVFHRVEGLPSPQCYVAPFRTDRLGETAFTVRVRRNGRK